MMIILIAMIVVVVVVVVVVIIKYILMKAKNYLSYYFPLNSNTNIPV
jgi:hypothetical protein